MKYSESERNSNIELMRLLSMLMIVMGHFVQQGNDIVLKLSVNDYILCLISSGSRIATNIFLIIGVYYLIEKKFNSKRITKLYGSMVFYTFSLTMISIIFFGNTVVMKDIARGFMPFWGRALWFVSAYITLILFAPLLNKIINNIEKKDLKLLSILCVVFVSIVSTLPDLQSAYVCDSMWFLVVYIIIGYIKKYDVRIKLSKYVFLFIGGGCTLEWPQFHTLAGFLPTQNYGTIQEKL